MMQELDKTGRVITLCSFSKIFAPGFRVGWVIGLPEILNRISMAKQTADLCTSPFVQKIIARYMEKGLLDRNLKKTIELYSERRTLMISFFKKYMPEGVTWTEPHGGLFLFVTLPWHLHSEKIFKKAIDKNVAFVAGSTFFCNNSGHNTMRINFSLIFKYLLPAITPMAVQGKCLDRNILKISVFLTLIIQNFQSPAIRQSKGDFILLLNPDTLV